jgi:hypothetical protein
MARSDDGRLGVVRLAKHRSSMTTQWIDRVEGRSGAAINDTISSAAEYQSNEREKSACYREQPVTEGSQAAKMAALRGRAPRASLSDVDISLDAKAGADAGSNHRPPSVSSGFARHPWSRV